MDQTVVENGAMIKHYYVMKIKISRSFSLKNFVTFSDGLISTHYNILVNIMYQVQLMLQ